MEPWTGTDHSWSTEGLGRGPTSHLYKYCTSEAIDHSPAQFAGSQPDTNKMKFAYLLALLPALAFAAPAQDKRIFYNPTTTGSYSQVSADVLASWVGAAHFTS